GVAVGGRVGDGVTVGDRVGSPTAARGVPATAPVPIAPSPVTPTVPAVRASTPATAVSPRGRRRVVREGGAGITGAPCCSDEGRGAASRPRVPHITPVTTDPGKPLARITTVEFCRPRSVDVGGGADEE